MEESLDYIYNQQKELSVFSGVGALLGWDQMTYMPKAGASDRSEQSALMSKLSHERIVSDTFWNHIQNLTSQIEKLEDKDRYVVHRLELDVRKSRKIPADYVSRVAKVTTVAYQKWENAREKNDFTIFSPSLKEIIELEKEYCSYINLPGPRYNSLLDNYEEGMTVDRLKHEFSILKKNLIKILNDIKQTKKYQSQKIIDLKIDKNEQKTITTTILDRMGFSLDRFRIDTSTHPFTISVGYNDVRITTNYDKANPLFSFFSTIHEAGHALYELGLPQNKNKNTVISDSPSLGLHESQSRFWENMIARSKNFWEYFYPEFCRLSPGILSHMSLSQWYEIINMVTPSLIRVEADELTYCLHVILRFEIENELMEDHITVDELPDIWNDKMNEFLGMQPTNDVEGVLQDMHWSGGNIGYFPTYAIGTIYASQLFEGLKQDQPDTINAITQGNFSEIIAWLQTKIHSQGRLLNADQIIKNVCGEGLNSEIYTNYLRTKYYEIYKV